MEWWSKHDFNLYNHVQIYCNYAHAHLTFVMWFTYWTNPIVDYVRKSRVTYKRGHLCCFFSCLAVAVTARAISLLSKLLLSATVQTPITNLLKEKKNDGRVSSAPELPPWMRGWSQQADQPRAVRHVHLPLDGELLFLCQSNLSASTIFLLTFPSSFVMNYFASSFPLSLTTLNGTMWPWKALLSTSGKRPRKSWSMPKSWWSFRMTAAGASFCRTSSARPRTSGEPDSTPCRRPWSWKKQSTRRSLTCTRWPTSTATSWWVVLYHNLFWLYCSDRKWSSVKLSVAFTREWLLRMCLLAQYHI